MAAHKRVFTPEQIAEAKRLYANTATPTRDIAALLSICKETLTHRVNEWKWQKRTHVYRSIDPARMVRGAVAAEVTDPDSGGVTVYAQPVSPLQRAALAQRIQAVVEREMGRSRTDRRHHGSFKPWRSRRRGVHARRNIPHAA